MNEFEFKNYLMKQTKQTLVELYLQKCFDSNVEKTNLIKEVARAKNDLNVIVDKYVGLLLKNNKEQRKNED